MLFKRRKNETSIREALKRVEEMQNPRFHSLYEYIEKNCVNGELPRDFSLPKKTEQGKIPFADGAMDGIAMYHMGAGTLDDEARNEMVSLIRLISDGEMTAADRLLADFAEKHTAISVIDHWQTYVLENREKLNADNMYQYSVSKLLHSLEVNEVKYGMMTLELFTLQDERVKEAVRTVGLSDEFTLFSIFLMLKWENSNDEIFRLAQHVHGWGRIHAVDRLEPATQEISDWLLHEGVNNSILPEYSALTCFEKADVRGRLQKLLSHQEFADIGNILACMLDEGPCVGISAVGDSVLETYLGHVQNQSLEFSDYQRILTVFHYGEKNDNHTLQEQCKKWLDSEECRRLVRQQLQRGEGLEIAIFLGLDYQKPLFECLKDQFDGNYHKVSYLMKEGNYTDRVIELFAANLPLQEMQTGPADEMGLGEKFADYRKLLMIVQELKDKPGKGEELLQTALRAPVINNRNMALTVLESWVETLEKPLQEISPALYQVLMEAWNQEMVENVRERMENLVTKFGKAVPISIHGSEYHEEIARPNIEASEEALQSSSNERSKTKKYPTSSRSQKFRGGSAMGKQSADMRKVAVFIIAIILIMSLFWTLFYIAIDHYTVDSEDTQQTEQFSEENEESPSAAAPAEQASDSSSEEAEEPVSAETSAPKRADCVQARDYFKDVIWEVKRASIFIHQQSGGQAYLKSNRWATQEPKPLYQEEELLGYYYNFTVSEVRPDSTEVRNCFYVKEDLSEILCLEAATGNLYDLESWRNSSEYAERMKEISDWQQEREELLLASEGQAPDEPWYDAYRAIVVDWTLIEDSDWSSDLDYLDFYFEEDYQFDSYWLCDIDQNGTPELFLYSDTGDMTNMVAVVTYTDRPVVVIVEMIAGINLETAECIIYGHWHGAGGSFENEWTGYRIQGDTAEYSMCIDYYDYNEEDRENHYVIYHPETDEFEYPVDGREYEEIYAAHVANCIWTWDIPKYDLVDDLSGLKVIYK